MVVNGTSRNGTAVKARDAVVMELHLRISDADLVAELSAYEDGEDRAEFAISALKIGTIALRQAQGRIDADTVRHEGELFIESMSHALDNHQNEVTGQISNCLKEYFDPEGGQFNQRVKSLIQKDGEIERVIRSQIEGDGSELARTLTTHVGVESPLMHMLDPNAKDGLINNLSESASGTLTEQRELILREFSLDNKEGALSRLLEELEKNHGEVGESLQNQIDTVTEEFSLDKEDSALSRLMSRVEGAQKKITREFSLDEEDTALARMQKKLLDVLENQRQTNAQFQEEVKISLAEMNTRKKEAAKSTLHGLEFEDQVYGFVNDLNVNTGDFVTQTGNQTGDFGRSKKGDVVIQLGSEHVATGARIVIEAKDDKSYTIDGALAELEEAKKNRDASIGLFVFSSGSAPTGLEAFKRYGDDLMVVWNAEDANTNVILEAGVSVSKALCVQSRGHSEELGADIDAIREAVLDIEKQREGLEEITKSASAIDNHVTKILNRSRIMGNNLDRQIGILNEKVETLRQGQ